jgi:hypothetical protein
VARVGVPIPFRDAADLDDLGVAAFLRIERQARGSAYLGALFAVNARGEPIELVYNAIETPHPFLWRPADLRRHAERRLVASLLGAAEVAPRLILCLAGETGAELFSRDVLVDVPVGRVDAPDPAARRAAPGGDAAPPVPDAAHVFWHPAPPADGSTERALFEQLAARGLLLEPFDRAADGLREVYGRRPDEGDEAP